MTTRDGVGFHKYGLEEFDVVCFVCPLRDCYSESPYCLRGRLEALRRMEKRGIDWDKIKRRLEGRKEV